MSPYKGQHYQLPVELVDIYPTLIDFNDFPYLLGRSCPAGSVCRPLNGRSLAPVVLGPNFNSVVSTDHPPPMPTISKHFAVTQVLRCAQHQQLLKINDPKFSSSERELLLSTVWDACGTEHRESEVSLMGYSVRTKSFRYTAYLPFNRRVNQVYNLTSSEKLHYAIEELYDHREDHLIPLSDRELVNVANSPKYAKRIHEMRLLLREFLKTGTVRVNLE